MPDIQELIRTAREAIGTGDSSEDWKVTPTAHAEMFEEAAPSLAEVLRGSRTMRLAREFERWDKKATAAGHYFKSTVTRADMAIFVTASLGALLLVGGGLESLLGNAARWLVGAVGLAGAASSAMAAMWLSQVRSGRLEERWAEARAKTEARRLAYFKAVMEGVSAEPLDQLLALEYARRFLLDNQIDYFQERGGQHQDAADEAVMTSTRAVFLATVFTAAAGLAAATVSTQLALLAGLAVVATAYGKLAESRSAVNLDQANVDKYRIAEDRLVERSLELEPYRKLAASGDTLAVQEFFEPVFLALEADHKAFLDGTEQRALAIGGMEARLDTADRALSGRPAEAGEEAAAEAAAEE